MGIDEHSWFRFREVRLRNARAIVTPVETGVIPSENLDTVFHRYDGLCPSFESACAGMTMM